MYHRSEPPPDLRLARPDAPAALVAMFERMVAKSPADRYASMDMVRDAAEQMLVEDVAAGDDEGWKAPVEERKLDLSWRSFRRGRTRHDVDRLVASLTSTLQEASTDQPVSKGLAETLSALRDQIEEVLRRRPSEVEGQESQPAFAQG